MQTSPLTLQRLQLAAAGFSPIPVDGKRPLMTGWQTKLETGEGEIELWERLYPHSQNTGILCKFTPTIDIDIFHPEAADAIEQLIRERFEEHGRILVRFGRWPKRAILLRTSTPFDKLALILTAPDGSQHKIETLGNGQQVVVAGIHPETRRPYGWHGGQLGEVKRAELPEVSEQDIRDLLDDAAELLVKEFGFTDKHGSKAKANGTGHQEGEERDPADWGLLFARILAGENLHDTLRDLAASFVASGMTDKAAVARLQSLMTASTAEKGARWRERYADIPRAVRTAREKLEHDGEEEIKPEAWTLHWHGEVDPRESRPWLVQDLIPEIGSGLVSGQWGTYKSFVVLDLAHSIMSGTPFIDFEIVRRGGVVLIALEGTGEVAVRLQGVIDHKGIVPLKRAPFAWTETCPPLLDKNTAGALLKLAEQAAAQLKADFDLPLALIAIDTSIAAAGYTKDGADNDTATSHAVMRTLAQVARKAGCFVLGIDHFGKDATVGTRGASVKEGDADVVLALLGEKSISGEVVNTRLALRKRRGGANGQEFPFKPRVVDMGTDKRGMPVTTLVLDWGETTETPGAKDNWTSKGLSLLKRIVMSLLADCGTDIKPWADGPTVRAINVELVRPEFYKGYFAEGDAEAKQTARQKAFKRSIHEASNKGLIAIREIAGEQMLWLAQPSPKEGHG
jgi:hypothetical protein